MPTEKASSMLEPASSVQETPHLFSSKTETRQSILILININIKRGRWKPCQTHKHPKAQSWTIHCTPDRRDPEGWMGMEVGGGFRMGNTEIQICVAVHRHKFHEALNLDKSLVQSTHKGQVPQWSGSITLQPAESRPKPQQSKQNEKGEKYAAGEGTW